ncbi:arginine transporter [Histidinibacterium aquaticum]|uniref:Arginine transporter n=1 Tax=Histidinibacterium aquaticum TaxID=2613962 RepID=A0A5J5GJ45_9RHOB|nr:arginine transporter [Histidinibacterium aquaticum]KAA9008261.1 arginine transporter [Histidinibacterium aquaticum]
MHRLILILAVLTLSSCGGGGARPTGAVGEACLAAGRSAANPRVCGCIDQVAGNTLTPAEQRAAANYFEDPEELQAMKLDDRPAAERMWDRYDNFVQTARAICS